MTREEAYIAGFCKVAESAGIDPVALYKCAQAKEGLVRGAIGLASRGGKRLWQLLRGGDKARLVPHAARMQAVKEQVPFTINGKTEGGHSFMDTLREYWKGLSGEHIKSRYARLKALRGELGASPAADAILKRERARLFEEAGATIELQKALATRLGVGAAGLYGLGKLLPSSKKKA